ncbi:hypothetical protein Cus16_2571 [Curtobacterium sp. ER1/6]|nr:hypothetical protein Cus16_2571 [Curtobacterium sp. ER1/6]
MFSTLTSCPRSIAAARRRCVEYACGARDRMASFIGVLHGFEDDDGDVPSKHATGWGHGPEHDDRRLA